MLKQNIKSCNASSEGNKISEKKTIYRSRVISKNATMHAQHTFLNLCRCFVEEISYMFLFSFFSLLLIFTLVTASISHFLTVATKFSCCSSTKKCLLCFLSLALALFLVELRWSVTHSLFFSVFPLLYIPKLQT